MRNKQGKFIEGHKVPKEWKKDLGKHPNSKRTQFKKGHKVIGGWKEGEKGNPYNKNRPKGEKHFKWKGGKKLWQGYVYISVGRGKPMADKDGYVAEHRLIMSKIIGRSLKTSELVHHKNGIRDDNKPKNLIIVTRRKHKGIVCCPYCENKFLIE